MKEIVVISGKGGTGKTSITASFALLSGEDLVVADCDVDAADMHLLLEPKVEKREDFYSGISARIDPALCTGCDECRRVCRFGAIECDEAGYRVDPIACEGCGYCARVCPAGAIEEVPNLVGEWYRSSIKSGATMIHAALRIGAENSGKLVAKVKNEAREAAVRLGKELVLVDGSPGIGCPVVSSLSGADYVCLVTEPSASGFHDLKRVYQLVARFSIPALCIINKADLNPEVTAEIRTFLAGEKIPVLGEIPYSEDFTRAMTMGKCVVEYDEFLKGILSECWKELLLL